MIQQRLSAAGAQPNEDITSSKNRVSARSCSLRQTFDTERLRAGYISLLYIVVLLVASRNSWNAGIYELFRWNCKIAPASPLSVDFYLFGRAERPVLQCLYNIFDKLGTDSGTLQQTSEAVGMVDQQRLVLIRVLERRCLGKFLERLRPRMDRVLVTLRLEQEGNTLIDCFCAGKLCLFCDALSLAGDAVDAARLFSLVSRAWRINCRAMVIQRSGRFSR